MKSLDQKKELLRKLLQEKSEGKRKFGLSQGQKAMWFLQSLDKSSVDYNTGFALKIIGEIDVDLFGECVKKLINRHAMMRSSIKEDENGEYQEIANESISLELISVNANDEKEVYQFIDNKLKEVYDLEKGDLARPTLFEVGLNEYIFLFAFHHIIYDEWTSRIAFIELITLYFETQKSPSFELPSIKKEYKDFVAYQHEIMNKPELISFWEKYLKNHESAILEFKGDKEFLETSTKKVEGEVINLSVEPELMNAVRESCRKNKVTVFNYMISVCQLALHKYTDQQQFFIGTPVAGRNNPDFHQTAGYFVNLLPLKCTIDPKNSFTSFLKENVLSNNLALAHQDFPFNRMVESFYGERSLSKHPFFNVAFTYYNQKRLQEDLKGVLTSIDNYHFEEYNLNSQESVFDITIEVKELSESGALKVKYDFSKYSNEMMEEFSNYIIKLLRKITDNLERSVDELTRLDDTIQVSEFQGEQREFNKEMNVYEMFKEQVECFPTDIAVKHLEKTYSYESLYKDIELIRSHIIHYVNPENPNIGLLTNSSIEMILGIFSILGAGGSYVPIKTELPENRFSFLVKNAGIQLLLCDRVNFEKYQFKKYGISALCIEDLLERNPDQSSVSLAKITSESPAYLMYTSGSTGTPKGLQIPHSNILNLLKNQNYVNIQNGDNIPQLSNYSFDGSVFDIFGSLLNGATLHIIDKKTMESTDELLNYFNSNSINIGFFTTALFNTLVSHDAKKYLLTFDRLLFGGEQVSTNHVLTALKYVKNKDVLVHVYGPTETTTFATFFPIRSAKENAKTIPIGKALSGVNVSIRSNTGEFVPKGVIGEICIKGSGLANGYYKVEELSKFKFDPLAKDEPMFATGDFGFMTKEGDIVFAGRKDHQIKLRGFRIELGEIEAALYKCENVGKAVAIVHVYNTDKSMIIAVVESRSGELQAESLKKELLPYLPDYMIPGMFIILEDLKLNKNAKIDRTLLLERVNEYLALGTHDKKEASTENEKILVKIWAEIFEMENVGVNESFFNLGGNSLLAMRVLSRIKYTTGVDLLPADIFETPTIAELASKIDNMNLGEQKIIKIKRSNRDKYLIKNEIN